MNTGKDADAAHNKPDHLDDAAYAKRQPDDYGAGVLDSRTGIAENAQDDSSTDAEASGSAADENAVAANEVVAFAEGDAELQREQRRRETEKHTAAMAGLDAELRNANSNIKLRKRYAKKAYSLAGGSIAFWIITMGFQAITHLATGKLALDASVLIAITTGCTINVLAAFLAVVKGLFPASQT
jgi:hypothetical protein